MSGPLVSHRYATEDGTEQLFYRTVSQAMYLSQNVAAVEFHCLQLLASNAMPVHI